MKVNLFEWKHTRIFFPVLIYLLISFAATTAFLFIKRHPEIKRWESSMGTKKAHKAVNTLNVFSIYALKKKK